VPMSPLSSAFSVPFSALSILISRLRAATKEPFCWRPTLCYRQTSTTESERCFFAELRRALRHDEGSSTKIAGRDGDRCGISTEDPSRPRLGHAVDAVRKVNAQVLVSGPIGPLRAHRRRLAPRRPGNPSGRDRQCERPSPGTLTTLVPMDGGGHRHLSNELVRRPSQGGEEVFRKVEMDTHADISRTVSSHQ
jgi:hypothetical protein